MTPGRSVGPSVYIALLRGINVGGNKKIPMADLRFALEQAGYPDARTHLQSGNVVLRAHEPAEELEKRLEHVLESHFSLQVRVLVRTPAQLEDAVAHNPFSNAVKEPSKLFLTFPEHPLDRVQVKEINSGDYAPDEVWCDSSVIYAYCPDGIGRSKLSRTPLDKRLKVVTTTRNWNTVTKLIELGSA